MIHSTAYGEFEINEKDDHLELFFKPEYYEKVNVLFNSRNELERIKVNLKMAYYDVEDISRETRENKAFTESSIYESIK